MQDKNKFYQESEWNSFFTDLVQTRFPKSTDLAFAYGSGVFPQENDDPLKQKMIDIVFLVDDPKEWHVENLSMNRNDYSFLKYFGPNIIAKVGCHISAGVYYNINVQYKGKTLKYGVISKKMLQEDLLHWKHLYLAGRLHKPVIWWKNNNVKLQSWQSFTDSLNSNLAHALDTSLVQLPESFCETDLYEKICDLSYDGDIRTYLQLDLNKPRRIVKPNLMHFQRLYHPILYKLSNVCMNAKNLQFRQDLSKNTRLRVMNRLPLSILTEASYIMRMNQFDKDRVIESLSVLKPQECRGMIKQSVKNIVLRSSTAQSIKGIFTTGIIGSMRYSCEKILKAYHRTII